MLFGQGTTNDPPKPLEHMAHGGAVAALMDYALSTSGEIAVGQSHVTASLTIFYRRPVPVPGLHQLWVSTSPGARRSSRVEGRLLDGAGEELASAQAVIVKTQPEPAAGEAPSGLPAEAQEAEATSIAALLESDWWQERARREGLRALEPSRPESERPGHYIRGQLSPFSGAEGMRMFCSEADPTQVVLLVRYNERMRNTGDTAHGGALAAVFDHLLIQSAVLARPGSFILTASLSVEYLLPLPLPSVVVAEATSEQHGERRFESRGEIRDQAGRVIASATAQMVDPEVARTKL